MTFKKGVLMKYLFVSLFMSASLFAQSINPVPIEKVFTPQGFDANDTSEVIISGYYPNLCYKNVFTKKERIGNLIRINVYANVITDKACAEAIVPFTKVVELGILAKGDYQVQVIAQNTIIKDTLTVQDRRSGDIDQFNYPLIEYIVTKPGSDRVILKAFKPSDCFIKGEVEYISDNKDTITVLPKLVRTSDFCPRKLTPIEYDITVPDNIPEKQYLLHVRSLSSSSVNKMLRK
tara:strand:- start:144610 stop:145311 length:702 start_codon:yes stop_codon:yes gene_type:complete